MKFFFLLLFVLSNSWFKPKHDVPLAIYHLKVSTDNALKLTIQFDKLDLAKTIQSKYGQSLTTNSTSQYLLAHSSWAINDSPQKLIICAGWEQEDHFVLELDFPKKEAPLQTMTIHNTCLVNEIDNHSNIVYLYYRGDMRGFRLSAKRLKTTFKF